MNRQELQAKLNTLLLGKNADSIYRICNIVEAEAIKWFRDSQGYIGIRLNNHTITITYKDRRIVSFIIKRSKVLNGGWVVNQVVMDENFIDTETSINAIRERFKKENENLLDEDITSPTIRDITEFLRDIKRLYPYKTAGEIKDYLYALHQRFWNAEENL